MALIRISIRLEFAKSLSKIMRLESELRLHRTIKEIMEIKRCRVVVDTLMVETFREVMPPAILKMIQRMTFKITTTESLT